MAGLVFGEQLFRIFNRDGAVIELGKQIIRVTFPFYFMYSILQIVGDSMRGVGKSRVPMLIVLINLCLIRTLLLFIVVPRIPGLSGVAACYPVTWTLTSVCMVIYYIRFHRRKEKEQI